MFFPRFRRRKKKKQPKWILWIGFPKKIVQNFVVLKAVNNRFVQEKAQTQPTIGIKCKQQLNGKKYGQIKVFFFGLVGWFVRKKCFHFHNTIASIQIQFEYVWTEKHYEKKAEKKQRSTLIFIQMQFSNHNIESTNW